MRLRTFVALAAAATAVAATPASAFIAPVCRAQLVNVADGTYTYCATENAPEIGSRVTRTVTVEVLAGTVDVWLTCGARSIPVFHVSGPQPVSRSLVEAGNNCIAHLQAADANTTATLTSTFLYTPVR